MQDELLGEIQRLVSYVEAVFRAVLNRPPSLAEAEKYANALYGGLSPIEFFHAVNRSEERKAHAKLFAVPGSYQSPVANPAELQQYVSALPKAGPQLAGIAIDRDAMAATWESLLPLVTTCPLPQTQTPGFYFYFQNMFYGSGDALMLQALIRRYAPKRLIEIGSGFSSACAVDTIDRFLHGRCELTFIEPFPARLLEVLGERARAMRFFETPVQSAPLEIYDELEAGDILFIDSSHVMRTGSDVCFELFEIFPRLRPGVLVHIHDLSWPFDYPENWILQQNRSYNEAYAVRAFLTDNPRWKIVFFNDYFAKFEGARIKAAFPDFNGEFGGSLWLERR
jgi:hypothetical protein